MKSGLKTRHGISRMAVMLLFMAGFHASVAQTIEDGFDPTFDHSLSVPSGHSMIRLADGDLIVGGSFDSVNGEPRANIVRLNLDGTVDTAFNPGLGFDGTVLDMALDASGRIVTVGAFTAFDGTPRNGLARLMADGSLDASFDPGAGLNGLVFSVVIQPDGRIVVAGQFTQASGQPRARVARYLADGSLDPSFNGPLSLDNPGNFSSVFDVILDHQGRLILGGDFDSADGQAAQSLLRLLPDGSIDTSFDTSDGPDGSVRSLSLLADQRLVVAGQFQNAFGATRQGVVILHPDATLDTAFELNVPLNGEALALAVQDNGQILIGGSFFTTMGNGSLIRVSPTGEVDTAFDQRVSGGFTVFDLWVEPNQDILFSGSLGAPNGEFRDAVARFHRDGQLDQDFSSEDRLNGFANGLAYQPNNRLLVGGSFASLDGTPSQHITVLDNAGEIDVSFISGTGLNIEPYQLVADGQGRTLVASTINQYNGSPVLAAFRLLDNGQLDPTFNPPLQVSDLIYSMAVDSEQRILLGGVMTGLPSEPFGNLVRMFADGSIDDSFDPGTGPNDVVSSIAIDPQQRILIAGSFTLVDGVSRRRIARLHPDGSLDLGFDPGQGVSSPVDEITLLPNGQLLISGFFNNVDGQFIRHLARLNEDGSLDISFQPEPSNGIADLDLLASGDLIVGGSFTQIDNELRDFITALNDDGTLDTAFDSSVSASSQVLDVEASIHGKVSVAGLFDDFGDVRSARLARFRLDEPAGQSLTQQADMIEWTLWGSMPMPEQVWVEQSADGQSYQRIASAQWTGHSWLAGGVVLEAGWSWLRLLGSNPPSEALRYDHYVFALPRSTFSSASLAFSDLQIGAQSSAQVVDLSNDGDARLRGTLSVSDAAFVIEPLTCGAGLIDLSPGEGCTLQLRFSPDRRGQIMGQLLLDGDASELPSVVSLTGTGLGIELAATQASVDFGRWEIGSLSDEQTIEIQSIGEFPASIGSLQITGSMAEDFMIVPGSDTCTGATLTNPQQCQLEVVFLPIGQGARQAELQVMSDAFNSPEVIVLEGNTTEVFLDGFE